MAAHDNGDVVTLPLDRDKTVWVGTMTSSITTPMSHLARQPRRWPTVGLIEPVHLHALDSARRGGEDATFVERCYALMHADIR